MATLDFTSSPALVSLESNVEMVPPSINEFVFTIQRSARYLPCQANSVILFDNKFHICQSRIGLIYYPLVILQGDLYSGSLKKNRLSIRKTDHVQFGKEIYLPELNEWEKYQIDVITEKYLGDYLKLVMSEAEKVSKILRKKREQIRFSINKIIAEVRKAKKKPESCREYFDF